MSSYSSHYIFANGITIHYTRSTAAAGKPAILMMHGITDYGLGWLPVANALGDGYDLVMPDMRGHGLSDKPTSGYTIETRAADAAALIEALPLNRPVVFGASLGGMDAVAFAGLYPNLVRGLILEDPAWLESQPGPQDVAGVVKESVENLIRDQRMTRAAFMEVCRQQEPLWSDEEIQLMATANLQVSPDSLGQILFHYRATAWREYLPKVQCPVLLITTEKDSLPGMVNPALVQEAHALSKMVKEAHLNGAGHCIHRDQFEACLRVVKEFLGTIKDFQA